MRDALVNLGVSGDLIELELCSLSTCENAYYSLQQVTHRTPLGVVTCDWHLPRALAAFRRAGASQVIGYGAMSPPLFGWRASRRALRERIALQLDSLATWGLCAEA